MAGGAAKEVDVEPPIKPLPDRVEVTEAHLANIMDPVSGAFVYVPGTGSSVGGGVRPFHPCL